MGHIDLCHAVICAAVELQFRQMADTYVPELGVVPDIKALELRVFGYVDRCHPVPESIKMRQSRIGTEIESRQRARAAHQVLELLVLGYVECLETCIRIAFKICKMRVFREIKRCEFAVKTIYPCKFRIFRKIERSNGIVRTPYTAEIFIAFQIYGLDLVVLAPKSLKSREVFNTLKVCYALAFAVNVYDPAYLRITEITVFVRIVSLDYRPEVGIGKVICICYLNA